MLATPFMSLWLYSLHGMNEDSMKTAVMTVLVFVVAIANCCLCQTSNSTDAPTSTPISVSAATTTEVEQLGTTDNETTTTTGIPKPQLCTPLEPVPRSRICQLPGRNSLYTYPQSIPGVQNMIELSVVEVVEFAIETLNPQPPQKCVDAATRVFCLLLAPPCDPVSDLRLPICERSCEAVTRLRLDESCTELDDFITNLARSSTENSFQELRDLYFAFDCRNFSMFDFFNGTLNFTDSEGRCTNIISLENEDLILNRPPACEPVPLGLCSQSHSTGYYFERSDLNYDDENLTTQSLNDLTTSVTDIEFCRNDQLLTDLVCLVVYPPCIPESGEQLPICSESCIVVHTFVSDCISGDFDRVNFNSSIADFLVATIANFTCSGNSSSHLTSGATISKKQCIELGSSFTTNSEELVIIISCLVAGVVIVTIGVGVSIIIILFICLRQRKRSMKMDISTLATNPAHSNMDINPYDGIKLAERNADDDCSCSEMSKIVHLTEADVEVYRKLFLSEIVAYSELSVCETIGQGAFGKVFKGQILKTNSAAVPKNVAIKTIKNMTSLDELKAFFEESLIMKDFDHPNVLGLAGVCFDTPDGYPFLILPFMVNGSLKNYLKKSRHHVVDVDTFPKDLPLSALFQMCLDIARGMTYLAERKFVHRDLAARNCMVDSNLTIKVGDFGLTRDVYSSDYYRANRNAKIPVKWMPPETLHDGISNEKTDIWSYGVTCWEVFSLGRVPYPGIDNHDVLKFVSSGGRLEKPTLCPHELYSIINLCWKLKPEDRPNFIDIYNQLEDYWDRENAYI